MMAISVKMGSYPACRAQQNTKSGFAFVYTTFSSEKTRAHTLIRKQSTPAKNGGSMAEDTKLIEKPSLVLRLAQTICRPLNLRASSSDITAMG